MSSFLPPSILKLIEEFSKLPGVGPKSAQRLTMHLLYSPESRCKHLSEAIEGLKKGLDFCKECWNIAEGNLCQICSDPHRNHAQICVVEEILDVVALEKTGEYHGVYHVLHGVLSPIDAVGPEQLKIQELVSRIDKVMVNNVSDEKKETAVENRDEERKDAVQAEVILATNPSLEGETTAMYLVRLLKSKNIRITRIARGLPAGGDLDYADELTLTRALQGRADYR